MGKAKSMCQEAPSRRLRQQRRQTSRVENFVQREPSACASESIGWSKSTNHWTSQSERFEEEQEQQDCLSQSISGCRQAKRPCARALGTSCFGSSRRLEAGWMGPRGRQVYPREKVIQTSEEDFPEFEGAGCRLIARALCNIRLTTHLAPLI